MTSETYRANVQAQRGLSTRRLTQLRRDWRLQCAVCKRAKKDEPEWADYLNAHRSQSPLEQQFAKAGG